MLIMCRSLERIVPVIYLMPDSSDDAATYRSEKDAIVTGTRFQLKGMKTTWRKISFHMCAR